MDTLVEGVSYLVSAAGTDAGGFYHGDTRHLTPVSVSIAGESLVPFDDAWRRPVERTRRYGRTRSAVNEISDGHPDRAASVVLTRTQRITEGRLDERVALATHGGGGADPEVVVAFDADFADIFEVRGHRDPRSRTVSADVGDRSVTYEYAYEAADGTARRLETVVSFDRTPETIEPGRATFAPTLGPQETWEVALAVEPGGDESTVRTSASTANESAAAESASPSGVAAGTGARPRDTRGGARADPFAVSEATTGDQCVDDVLRQARRDVRSLTTETASGPVPLAGAPWFVTVFGRDAALAAYLLLPFAPALARGTVGYLAAHQGGRRDDATDERPGKMFHEIRRGELARTSEVPHTPYYGAVDTTPLWIVLLSEFFRWSGDDAFVREHRSNLTAALEWIDRETAAVGDDPFLYYRNLGTVGVSHREWRDSAAGVQFADGTVAEPPLASAAVQGYVYDGLVRASELASVVLDADDLASTLAERADELARAFDDAFWMPDRSFYATAVTEGGRRVDSVTSSVGHCLWSGIVPAARADAVATRLLAPESFSGWGIRTLAAGERGYDPVSYHAGSVWPHDNALAALGLANAGHRTAATRVARSQFEAFGTFEGNSVPELFCGFDDSSAPVPYAAACTPQSWAAAAPYGFVRALFGLGPGGRRESPVRESAPGLSADAVAPVLDHWR